MQFAGSLLLGIAVKLLTDDHEQQQQTASPTTLRDAIRIIILADLVMSLDNVIAVAAVARGSLLYLIIGLGLSIPNIMFGSQMVQRLMAKWPAIEWVGAAFLGWTAGDMAGNDVGAGQLVQRIFPALLDWLPALFAVFVVAVGLVVRHRRK